MTRHRRALWPRLRIRTGGRIVSVPGVGSAELGNTRDLSVWLPSDYARSERRYPVIYMHDGQNLFDPRTSFAEPWRVDDAMRRASRRGLDAIVVGIPNMGAERIAEYSPYTDARAGGGRGDLYLDWVIGTVKPLIDTRFRTRPGRAHTGMAGASMGGLITLYAYLRDPSVFGFIGVLSPALWFAGRAVFDTLAAAGHHAGRIYLDMGALEGQVALRDARDLRDALVARGYVPGRELRWVEDPAGRHNEVDWGRRFTKALPFLLRGS